MFVKVCGITRLEDAKAAYHLGFSAVGFIFVPESPRYIPPDRARLISHRLPTGLLRVGVVAGMARDEVRHLLRFCQLDLVQFHGGEGPDEVAPFAPRAIKALRPTRQEDLEEVEEFPPIFAFLVDTWSSRSLGGTGRTADWSLAARLAKHKRVILAGGLREENVLAALKAVRPFGLDVNSGVERAPGIKDGELMARFISRAKESELFSKYKEA